MNSKGETYMDDGKQSFVSMRPTFIVQPFKTKEKTTTGNRQVVP